MTNEVVSVTVLYLDARRSKWFRSRDTNRSTTSISIVTPRIVAMPSTVDVRHRFHDVRVHLTSRTAPSP
jgi:hypothetical protein